MILSRALRLLAVCCIALITAGCAPFWTGTPEAEPAPPAAVRPDPAEMRLAEAAARAEAALTALARIESARTPGAEARAPGRSPVPGSSPGPGSSPALEDVPAALRRAVTLDWIGPVETLAETLAQHAGYRFVAAGSMPVRPVMVTVRAAGTPLIEVLRDAGLQAGAAATLVVDAGNRTVRLDWTRDHLGPGDHPGPGEPPRTGERPDSRERTGSAPGKEGS